MPDLYVDDFSGGLNLRDAPNKVAPWESPAATNVALDERGGFRRRAGCGVGTAIALPGTTGTKAYLHYSAALDLWLCARASGGTLKLFTRPGDLSGAWTDRGTINSVATAKPGFVDFPGNPAKVVLCTNVNSGATEGVFTYDTAAGLVAIGGAGANVCGDAVALWQNKVWIAGYPTSDANGNPTRLFRCAPGDPATWGDFTDFRENDPKPLTALGVAGGGLIVFKDTSAYRVTDAATSAFSTLDGQVGCVNARSLVPLRGRLYVWNKMGIYESDGVGPLTNVGDKLRPHYHHSGTDHSTVCAGRLEDKAIFAGLVAGSQRIIELHPRHSEVEPWLMEHGLADVASNEPSSFAVKDRLLYAALSDSDLLWSMFSDPPGSDGGTQYVAQWRTPWLLPNSGMLARLHRLIAQGLIEAGTTAAVALKVYKDWTLAGGVSYDVTSQLLAASADQQQLPAHLQSLGHSTAFAIEVLVTGNVGHVSIRAIQLVDALLQSPNPGYPAGQRARPPGSFQDPPFPGPGLGD